MAEFSIQSSLQRVKPQKNLKFLNDQRVQSVVRRASVRAVELFCGAQKNKKAKSKKIKTVSEQLKGTGEYFFFL